MKYVFFDTNFLFYSTTHIFSKDAKELKDNGFIPLTSKIVIKEMQDRNYREISSKYKELNELLSNQKVEKYFKLNNLDVNLNQAITESDEAVDTYVNSVFDEIIDMPTNEHVGEVLFARYRDKMPPFVQSNEVDNKSDKGWKDTLIWTGLLEYLNNKDFEMVYFVSKDKAFSENNEKLIAEFKQKTGKDIKFLNVNDVDGLMYALKLKELPNKPKGKQLSEQQVEEIRSAIDNVMVFEYVYNNFGDSNPSDSFVLYGPFEDKDIIDFCNELEDAFPNYLFLNSIDINNIFANHFNGHTKTNFSNREIKNFINAWKEIKNNYQNHIPAFCATIRQYFTRMLRDINDSDDLPF